MVRILGVCILALFISGCQADISLDQLTDAVGEIVDSNDYLNSYVTVSSPVAADGTALVTVTVYLINSDNSKVSGKTPTYTVITGNGLITFPCSKSSLVGVSYCKFKSTVKGTKQVDFNNLNSFSLSANPVFTFAAGKNTVQGIVPGGSQKDISSGYTIYSSIGLPYSGVRITEPGYKIYNNIQGQIESVNEP